MIRWVLLLAVSILLVVIASDYGLFDFWVLWR
jgi:hypothetical protein